MTASDASTRPGRSRASAGRSCALVLLALLCAGCGGEAPDRANQSAGVTVPLPPPLPYSAPEANVAAKAEAPELAVVAPDDGDPPAPREQPEAKEEPAARPKVPPEPGPADAPAAPSPPAPKSAEKAATSLQRPPLPDATIAGTIRRIGYRCPEVTGSAPMESDSIGATAFRITCSSGDAYRATVRQGRMRFRKL